MRPTARSEFPVPNIDVSKLVPLIGPAHVEAEQRRRLAAGFDFDFGDARGVHHIAIETLSA